MRAVLIGLGIGVLGLALAVALGGASSSDLLRSTLAAWLVIIAMPLGALPVVMALDLAGIGATPGTAPLRLLLAALPAAAVLGVLSVGLAAVSPSHLHLAALYGSSSSGSGDFAARWFAPAWLGARTIVYLVIWVALALVFLVPASQPSARRSKIAAWGLALHLVVGTLAAIDWTMSLDLGPKASAFGLLLISLQCAFALTLALLMTAVGSGRRSLRVPSLMTLVAVAAATFMQFEQYLVVWSANLPREIVWYQHRLAGLGATMFIAAPFILIVAAVVLMPVGLSSRRWPVVVATALLLLLEVADLLWLVTPAWRASFVVSVLDLSALVGLAGLIGAGALFVTHRTKEARHG